MSEELKEDAVLIYDYESTGPDPKTAMPVQIAATLHRVGKHPLIVMNALCNPGIEIEAEASEVHGLYQKDVRNKPPAEILTYMLGEYAASLNETYNLIIGGQNHIGYDNPIAVRMGWTEIVNYPQIDLLILARRFWPRSINHKLDTLYFQQTGKELSGAHDAIVDVVGVGTVLETLLEEFEGSYKVMAESCGTPQAWDVMPISKKHKGKFMKAVPRGFMKWMCENTTMHKENADFAETLKVHFNYLWQIHCEGD